MDEVVVRHSSIDLGSLFARKSKMSKYYKPNSLRATAGMRRQSSLRSEVTSILQIQSFWLAFTLSLHYSLTRRSEVCHLDSHSPFSQCEQACFGTDGFDVGPGKIVLLVDELIKLDVVAEGHLGCVEIEDLAFGVFCVKLARATALAGRRIPTVRVLKENLAVNSPRTDKSRVQGIDFVCSQNDFYISPVIKPIQLVE